jgi:hypothetical protein
VVIPFDYNKISAHNLSNYLKHIQPGRLVMKSLLVGFSALVIAGFASPASADNGCKDILVSGTMTTTQMRSHTFFLQILAAEFAQKTDEQTDEKLSHDGSMSWAGIGMGGKFNKDDAKRYIQELRSKLDISTVLNHESSVLLASGDPQIVGAWSKCMQERRGLSMRFEASSAKSVALILEWYAFPVAPDVSTDTYLKEDILIPKNKEKDIQIVSGKDCLSHENPLRDKIPCTVNLEFTSGETDLLLTANAIHGTTDAYLPQRLVLKPEREIWQPQPGEQKTAGVYTFSEDKRSPSVCLAPKKDWSFVAATMEANVSHYDGPSGAGRCSGEIKPNTPSFLCFNSRMVPNPSGDHHCSVTLQGQLIRWNVVDGLGL